MRGGVAQGLGNALVQRAIPVSRIVECSCPPRWIEKQMRVEKSVQNSSHHRTMGMPAPRKEALVGSLVRCTGRRWNHRGASGKDSDRQSHRMETLRHFCPILPLSFQEWTFGVLARAPRRRKVVLDSRPDE
jgi:hypothetical protein